MITANFTGQPADKTLDLDAGLWQFDTGQKLQISGVSGLSETTEVHFGIKNTDRAIVKTGEYDSQSNVLTVDIPNRFLEQSDDIFGQIWVYIRESETSAYTIRKIRIPIIPRERPDDYISPEDISGKTAIEAAVSNYFEKHPVSVTPENYGAAGDGATDDTAAVQSAIDYSIAHKVPFRGKTGAVYLISKPIQIVMSESRAFYGAFDFDGSTIKTTDTFSDNFKNICLVMNRKPDDWESAYSNYYKSENGQFVPVTLVSKVVDGETTYVVPGFFKQYLLCEAKLCSADLHICTRTLAEARKNKY